MEDDALTNWRINGETACYALDEHHTLYITRDENGVMIKVKANVPIVGLTDILYIKHITNGQLGYECIEGKDK
jgi:hypothetical protein